jgi:hypothetical protein
MKHLKNKRTEAIELGNGLTLEILDQSRQVVGDRWLVSFVARVETEVRPELFERDEISKDQLEGIQALAGEKVSYQYEDQRNFVDNAEREQVLKTLKERFLKTNLKYLSTPEFPKKLMLSKSRS